MGFLDENEIEQAKQLYRDKPKDPDGRMGGSTSYLQRRMKWGYNHAATIVEELEKRGFLSEPDRNGMRFVNGK